jgi:23S rRNA (uracil1939-C5)-methyltransferase
MSRDSATPAANRCAAARQARRERPQVRIEDMTLGPYGIGRLDGMAVMVPDAAPGDLLQVTITQTHRDYCLGKLESVVAAGAARRAAPCPFLPRCGGCDWQQIDYAHQVILKGRLIAAELKRTLGLEIDPLELVAPAAQEFGYRSRLRLKVDRGGALGFFEAASNHLVEVDRCLVADDQLNLASAAALARMLKGRCEEIEVVRADHGQVLVIHLRGRVRRSDLEHAGQAIAGGSIAGIVVRGGGDRSTIGDVSISIELEPGLRLKADADAFSQINHERNRALVAAVMAQAAIEPGMKVLDLFCGAGNFSLPAARRGAQVMGVDADPIAIGAAQRNADNLGFDGARFTAMAVQEVAPFLLRAGYRPHTVILDPPRTGARQLMNMIGDLGAARVVYVSCDAATLARDLRILSGHGYAPAYVKAFDFFPNTHHCEVLALLT